MINLIGNITHRTKTENRKLNILTSPTHESFELNLSLTGHNFYSLYHKSVKTWNEKYRECPNNYILLKENRTCQIPPHINFDLVLIQNKFGQYQLLKQIADRFHIPTVVIEHTLAYPDWPKDYIQHLKSMRGDINVFISEYSRNIWGWSPNESVVIHHGINTSFFKPNYIIDRDNCILTVCNDFINRNKPCGFDLWRKSTEGLPTKVLGDTPGLSKPASSMNELVETYQKSKIYINTSLLSPIPMSLLEAMSCGCAPISTATCMIPEIIKHEENGLLGNTEKELRENCLRLLRDDKLCKKLGENARETILNRFPLDKFIENYNNIFIEASRIIK